MDNRFVKGIPMSFVENRSPEVCEKLHRWAKELQTTSLSQTYGQMRRISPLSSLCHFFHIPAPKPSYCAVGIYWTLFGDKNLQPSDDWTFLCDIPPTLYCKVIQWNDKERCTFPEIGQRIESLLQNEIIRVTSEEEESGHE